MSGGNNRDIKSPSKSLQSLQITSDFVFTVEVVVIIGTQVTKGDTRLQHMINGKVYTAVTENEALENLMAFKEKWGKQYPSCVKSWEDNWDILSAFFAYPTEIRKIIYTTNIIEGLNRQFRQITKNKPSFTNDDSLRRMLYLASRKIVKHWTARCRNWDVVLSQLQLMFQDRLTA